jgi:hypothetical protein
VKGRKKTYEDYLKANKGKKKLLKPLDIEGKSGRVIVKTKEKSAD